MFFDNDLFDMTIYISNINMNDEIKTMTKKSFSIMDSPDKYSYASFLLFLFISL